MDCLESDDWAGIAELMLGSANKLAAIGADFLICPDNTIHQALPQVLPRSPLPWLHIAEVVADEAARRGFRRLGLTGTRWLVDGPVYTDVFRSRGMDLIKPTDTERDGINRIIIYELIFAEIKPESMGYFQQVIGRMAKDGCDAVILGCTEIPLLMKDTYSPLPMLDSTWLLARAAVERAVSR
jgi:aspartate racemase